MEDCRFIVWCGDKGCGGLGDRVVGIVSCYILSMYLNRKFLIHWVSPDISDAVTLNKEFSFGRISKDLNDSNVAKIRWIDQRNEATAFLKKKKFNLWKDVSIVMIENNQMIHDCLFDAGEAPFRPEDFTQVTKSVYAKLFQSIFEPTTDLHVLVSEYLKEVKDSELVGIQVRMGDFQMQQSFNHLERRNLSLERGKIIASQLLQSNLKNDLQSVKKKVVVIFIGDTDMNALAESAQTIFNNSNVAFNVKTTTTALTAMHIDHCEKPCKEEILFLFRDLLILSHCDYVIASNNSNFGRISPYLQDKCKKKYLITANDVDVPLAEVNDDNVMFSKEKYSLSV